MVRLIPSVPRLTLLLQISTWLTDTIQESAVTHNCSLTGLSPSRGVPPSQQPWDVARSVMKLSKGVKEIWPVKYSVQKPTEDSPLIFLGPYLYLFSAHWAILFRMIKLPVFPGSFRWNYPMSTNQVLLIEFPQGSCHYLRAPSLSPHSLSSPPLTYIPAFWVYILSLLWTPWTALNWSFTKDPKKLQYPNSKKQCLCVEMTVLAQLGLDYRGVSTSPQSAFLRNWWNRFLPARKDLLLTYLASLQTPPGLITNTCNAFHSPH